MNKKVKLLKCALAFTLITTMLISAPTGRISGRITDKSGTALPGANIVIVGQKIGAAANVDGDYVLTGITPGEHEIKVTYIGFQEKTVPVEVEADEVTTKNIALSHKSIEGEEVEITAQALGQTQAINQQVESDAVTNVVSSEKIQALPEANAAEAVGRLPGISLKRSGGEGNKIVVRGLSPKYNSVQIDGVSMASTDTANRSTDVSMISPYMLKGIEVSKTAMANQNAGNLGGIVNFQISKAPEEPKLNIVTQGGYNSLREEATDYNVVVGGSRRFFDNKIGLYLQGNLEKRNRSENNVWAGYRMLQDSITIANNMGAGDVSRIKNRRGGTGVLDYADSDTKIKLFGMYNSIDISEDRWEEQYDVQGNVHNYNGLYEEKQTEVMVSALDIEQYFGDVKMEGGVNYSSANNEVPEHFEFTAQEDKAFQSNWNYEDPPYLHPDDFKNKAVNDTSNIKVNQHWLEYNTETNEEQYSADLNFQWDYDLTEDININFQTGGKYRHKDREYDKNQTQLPIGWGDFVNSRKYIKDRLLERYPENEYPKIYSEVENYSPATEVLPYRPFIKRDYKGGNFMAGNYKLNRVPNIDLVRDYYHDLKNTNVLYGDTTKTVYKDHNASALNDYHGYEDYYAAYIMPKISINGLTLIPGFRYENNVTTYTGIRASSTGKWNEPFKRDTTTKDRQNDHILPMLHAKYKLTENFDIKGSYTMTLSRPSYEQIIPSWTTWNINMTWNNPKLKPAVSRNYDLYLTYAGDKSGLITVGGFYKDISDFIYRKTQYIADSSYLKEEYPEQVGIGGRVFGNINNPNDATLYGIEAEWQANLWFLPGLWKNIVLNTNYTYIHSELTYPKVGPKYSTGVIKKLEGTIDKSYTAPLLDQPDHKFNLTIGYDYKGLSLRTSMQYKSNVFIANNFYPELRQRSDAITFYDMKIQQQLPVEGLQLYCNLSNISEAIERNSNNGTGWYASKNYYGMTADLGLRYNF